MTRDEITKLQEAFDAFKAIDWGAVIETAYPNQPLDEVQLDHMPLSSLMRHIQTLTAALERLLQNEEELSLLPNTFQEPGRESSSTIRGHLVHVSEYVQKILKKETISLYYATKNEYYNISHLEKNILVIIDYLKNKNLFIIKLNKNETELINFLNEVIEQNRLLLIDLKKQRKQSTELLNQLKKAAEIWQKNLNSTDWERKQITESLDIVQGRAAKVEEYLTASTGNNATLNEMVRQQRENMHAMQEEIDRLEKLYEDETKRTAAKFGEAEARIQQFDTQKQTFDGHIAEVEGKKTFFDERLQYLEDLIGREVGVSLFETFKQRKLELAQPVRFWQWAVPVMAVITTGWIFGLFYYFSPPSPELWWNTFALNSLKSLPAIGLLLFTINQYRKERNFQEEYAFKSAVALTIQAYAGQLQDAANKDKLIMESVAQVYASPTQRKPEKDSGNPLKESAGAIVPVINSIKELVKSVKP